MYTTPHYMKLGLFILEGHTNNNDGSIVPQKKLTTQETENLTIKKIRLNPVKSTRKDAIETI